MYTRRNIRWSVVLRFAWWQILVFVAWGALVTWLYLFLQQRGVDCSLPIAPLGTIGVAVAFYVGFKNNQSYDRYWEARKIWGGIVNVSRTWANQVLSYVSNHYASEPIDPKAVREIQQTLVYRHLAWINSLRYQLRRKTPFGFQPKGTQRRFMQTTDIDSMRKELNTFLSAEELKAACDRFNTATQVLRFQGEQLRKLMEQSHLLDEFRLISLMDLITEMYTLQGKCERIKNTPFPRQYAYFSNVFTWLFTLLLPFGIVGQFAGRGLMVWAAVPLSAIISWVFLTMETVGDTSEDPFENFLNDVPMTALCRTIEIDLRQMLGETEVPPPLQPEQDILM